MFWLTTSGMKELCRASCKGFNLESVGSSVYYVDNNVKSIRSFRQVIQLRLTQIEADTGLGERALNCGQ